MTKLITDKYKASSVKSKIVLLIVFLLLIPATLAETWLPTDSNQVCEGRNNVYKSGLEAAIKTKQNVAAAKAELDLIHQLPSTLSPCEKQEQIPGLSNDEASQKATEALKDRKIFP